jgi:hypothetical protein
MGKDLGETSISQMVKASNLIYLDAQIIRIAAIATKDVLPNTGR